MAYLSDEQFTAILKRLSNATPGVWRWEGDLPDGTCPHDNEWTDHGPDLVSSVGTDSTPVITSSGYDASSLNISAADADFILNAPQDIADLLAKVDQLQAELQRLPKGRAIERQMLRNVIAQIA